MASAWERVGASWISMIRSTSRRQPSAACSTSARYSAVTRVVREQLGELAKRLAGVAHQSEGGLLVGVEFGHVEVDELHVRVGEQRVGGRGEVGVAGADSDDQIGLVGERVREHRSGGAEGVHHLRVFPRQAGLAGLGDPDRDAGPRREVGQLGGGGGVDDAAAGDDHRPLRLCDQLGGAADSLTIGAGARHIPDPWPEEAVGEVPGFGLHVLGKAEGRPLRCRPGSSGCASPRAGRWAAGRAG